jgi:hypothetical protein
MQTCKIKWIKTIRNKNMRTYWIWNEGDENKNLPNIRLIKRKNITWGDRKEKKNAQQMFWQQSFKGMIMHTQVYGTIIVNKLMNTKAMEYDNNN